MTQPQDKMRAEFEATMLQQRPHSDFHHDDGGYVSPWLQAAWTGWLAACAQQSAQSQQDALDAARYRWMRGVGHEQLQVAMHYADKAMDEKIDATIAAQGASNV